MSQSMGFSVGQVAERSGVSVPTLHFYESKGLIFSTRNAGNQRRYEKSVLRRVAVIKTAQRLGLSLQDIANAFASLPPHKAPTTADWRRLSSQWRQQLDAQIHALEKLRNELDQCIGCGCLSIKACKLRNPDDEAGDKGTGAVFWDGNAR